MMNLKDKVFASQTRTTVALASRGSGKTSTALVWLLEYVKHVVEGKSVAYVGPTRESVRHAEVAMRAALGRRVQIQGNGIIRTTTGHTLRFIAANSEAMRGSKFDAIAFDNAESIKLTDTLKFLAAIGETKVLAVGNGMPRGSFLEYLAGTVRPNTTYLEHTWMDEVRDGRTDIGMIETIRSEMSPDTFKQEFGPWDIHKGKENEDFLHLLKKI